MRCGVCDTQCEDNSNFCSKCGAKLKEICNCWLKKGNYNCGEKNCPGYGLFRLEKLKSK